MTYDDAIENVMLENGGFASLKFLYKQIWNYKDKNEVKGKTPNNTIQERCQRNLKIIRIAYGVYALKSFIDNIESNKENLQIILNSHIDNQLEVRSITQSQSMQNIRIGQQDFRRNLLETLKECPITHIKDKKLLITSHIKPWVFCNNQERLNIYNGFLLSPLFDKLFDKSIGLITFTQNKEILFSSKMDKSTREYLKKINVMNGQIITDLPINGRESFLNYHYKYIYQK